MYGVGCGTHKPSVSPAPFSPPLFRSPYFPQHPTPASMERRPAESKRSPKDKAKKEPVEEEEVAAGGGVDEDKKRRTSSCSSTAVAAGGGVGVGGASGASSVGAGVMVGRRGSSGGVTQPSCQAERCTADLTEAKRYHRRHKVCEAHSKAPVVIVAGLRQRFCQQCSRFHELSEFDEAKRSCRRRLAGHNERRRKSSSESQADGSNRCSQADQGGRMQISLPGNPTYKHFQIR